MIEGSYNATNTNQPAAYDGARKVLRMVKNERMGGFVPVWETVKNSSAAVEADLAAATASAESQISALGYGVGAADAPSIEQSQQEFSFGDLLDMVNPLHHIPVVGHVYRELSGDQIRPISQIIGGAVFGGPMGAASGLINVVIEHETGKDLTGNAVALALHGERPNYKSEILSTPSAEPEIRLAAALEQKDPAQDMPGSLLSFVDMKHQPQKIIIERVQTADSRTAGDIAQLSYPDLSKAPLHIREPITQVRLSQNFND